MNGWTAKALLLFAALLTGCLPAVLIAQEGSQPAESHQCGSNSPGPTGIEQTVGTIATGVAGSVTMGGLCWYMLSKALPAKDECNAKQRQEHLTAFEKQQSQFIAELREDRQAHRESVKELVAELAREREERVEMIRHCAAKTEKA